MGHGNGGGRERAWAMPHGTGAGPRTEQEQHQGSETEREIAGRMARDQGETWGWAKGPWSGTGWPARGNRQVHHRETERRHAGTGLRQARPVDGWGSDIPRQAHIRDLLQMRWAMEVRSGLDTARVVDHRRDK